MAVVIYLCDTCDREIMIPRNEEGLEHIGRCNITLGCRGKLLQQKVLEDYQRGRITEPVSGLDDWHQRKVLHIHDQTVKSTEWIVKHDFGTNPMIVAYTDDPINEGEREERVPDNIEILSPDILKIIFDEQYSGIAHLIARQADPDMFTPVEDEAEEEESIIRASYSSELTIATRISTLGEATIFRVRLTYLSDDGSTFDVIYLVDDVPSATSPWSDYDKISTKGKLYTVRSFNFIATEMADGGRITSGSNVYMDEIDNGDGTLRSINPEDVLILLANDPYKSVDKNPNIYIDASETVENKTSIVYDRGSLYAGPNIVRNIYPPIYPAPG